MKYGAGDAAFHVCPFAFARRALLRGGLPTRPVLPRRCEGVPASTGPCDDRGASWRVRFPLPAFRSSFALAQPFTVCTLGPGGPSPRTLGGVSAGRHRTRPRRPCSPGRGQFWKMVGDLAPAVTCTRGCGPPCGQQLRHRERGHTAGLLVAKDLKAGCSGCSPARSRVPRSTPAARQEPRAGPCGPAGSAGTLGEGVPALMMLEGAMGQGVLADSLPVSVRPLAWEPIKGRHTVPTSPPPQGAAPSMVLDGKVPGFVFLAPSRVHSSTGASAHPPVSKPMSTAAVNIIKGPSRHHGAGRGALTLPVQASGPGRVSREHPGRWG